MRTNLKHYSFVDRVAQAHNDKYPVTTEGRIIAAFLMTTGVGLFGTFAGFIASWFVAEKKEEEQKNEDIIS